jgi:hypothetical protein
MHRLLRLELELVVHRQQELLQVQEQELVQQPELVLRRLRSRQVFR